MMVPRSGLLARDSAREDGRELGRLPGLDTGADEGGETWSLMLSVLSNSESIQLLWSSGCASSASSGGGEEVVGVDVPDRLIDDRAENPPKPPKVLWWLLRRSEKLWLCRRSGEAGREGGREAGGETPGVPVGVLRVLHGVGAKPDEAEYCVAVSAFATRSMMWSWYEGRSTCGTSEWASAPDGPKRRLRDPAEAMRASSCRHEARM